MHSLYAHSYRLKIVVNRMPGYDLRTALLTSPDFNMTHIQEQVVTQDFTKGQLEVVESRTLKVLYHTLGYCSVFY